MPVSKTKTDKDEDIETKEEKLDTKIEGENLLDDAVKEVTENQQEPNEELILEHQKEKEGQEKTLSGLVDNLGNPFDKNLHRVNRGGDPVLTKTGKLTRKTGRKITPKIITSQTKSDNKIDLSKRGTAEIYTNLLIGSSVALGGDEFKPKFDDSIGLDEKGQMADAFEQYLIKKDMPDLPPGVVLSITICGYLLPRLTMPKTQTRIGKLTSYFKNKFFRGGKSAQPNIGGDGVGEKSFE